MNTCDVQTAIDIVNDFCDQECIDGWTKRRVAKAFNSLDFSKLNHSDWFVVMDALGCDDDGKAKNNSFCQVILGLSSITFYNNTQEAMAT